MRLPPAQRAPMPIRTVCSVLLLILVVVSPVDVFGQTARFTVSGNVRDTDTGESLPGANIYAPSLSKGATSNTYGFFSLTLPVESDSIAIIVSFVGYTSFAALVPSNRDSELTVLLQTTSDILAEVEVTAERAEAIEESSRMSVVEIPIEQIKDIPALLGEVDIIKALQLLPGVQSGSEGSSGLYVRGGGPDQNLILLDGAPVYNASHLFGFFSVFNADAIRNVELTKGGFPARYGGRLSSVLDISMKEGNLNKFTGEGAIGIVASRLTLQGPISRGTTSFLVSGRRTYIDVLAQPFIRRENRNNDEGDPDGTGGYFFYDLNAKVNHIFSSKDRLYLSFYGGRDKFYFREKESRTDFGVKLDRRFESGLQWGNVTSTLRWNHLFSNTLFSNTTLTFSDYEFDITGSEDETLTGPSISERNSFLLRYFSGIRDYGARIDFDFVPLPEHYIRFGVNTIAHRFSPGAAQYKSDEVGSAPSDTTFAPSNPINALESAAYVEDDWSLSARVKINAGLHASMFNVEGETYGSLQPRLSARIYATADWSVKASVASMAQYIHLLTNSGIGLPTDLWLPATDRVRPQRAWQGALGIAHTFQEKNVELSIEGYYKSMRNLIDYKPGANFIGLDSDWQDKVESGDGRAYGTELLLRKTAGAAKGWIGYTLSWSDRQFPGLNDGRRYPYRYDRRHDISVVLTYPLGPGVTLGTTWVFGTGNAITLPNGVVPTVEPLVSPLDGLLLDMFGYGSGFVYGDRNASRLRSYHRLDVGLNFVKQKRWGERTISIGAYNTYNRKNPFYVYLSEDFDFEPSTQTLRTDRKLKQVTLFPIIPSLSYRFSF